MQRIAWLTALVVGVGACGGDDGGAFDSTPTFDGLGGVDGAPADARDLTGATLVWEGPGGFTGVGPALAIGSDGVLHLWDSIGPFEPALPPNNFDRTLDVSDPQLQDLFARWATTNHSGLPHPGGGSECGPLLYVRTCGTCTPTQINYTTADQLEPEMESMWQWFDAVLANEPSANNPRNFCRL